MMIVDTQNVVIQTTLVDPHLALCQPLLVLYVSHNHNYIHNPTLNPDYNPIISTQATKNGKLPGTEHNAYTKEVIQQIIQQTEKVMEFLGNLPCHSIQEVNAIHSCTCNKHSK